MGIKILNRDGGTTTITDEDLRKIDEHNQGKSLAEVAAAPPAFAHLLEKRDPPPQRSIWQKLAGLFRRRSHVEEWPRIPDDRLPMFATMFGCPPDICLRSEIRQVHPEADQEPGSCAAPCDRATGSRTQGSERIAETARSADSGAPPSATL